MKIPDNEKELLLLGFLRQDARIKIRHVSRETKMPQATLHIAMKRLDKGVVKKYSSLIDFQRLGFGIGCFFIARMSRRKKEKHAAKAENAAKNADDELLLLDVLWKNSNVNSVYMTSSRDLIVEAWFRDMRQLFEFKDLLSEFCSVDEHEIIESCCVEDFRIAQKKII